jgi:hypothetical protein
LLEDALITITLVLEEINAIDCKSSPVPSIYESEFDQDEEFNILDIVVGPDLLTTLKYMVDFHNKYQPNKKSGQRPLIL